MVYLPVLFSKLGHLLNIFADLANIDIFFDFSEISITKKTKWLKTAHGFEHDETKWIIWNQENLHASIIISMIESLISITTFHFANWYFSLVSSIDWICRLYYNKEIRITVLWTVSIIAKITFSVSIWKLRCKTMKQDEEITKDRIFHLTWMWVGKK